MKTDTYNVNNNPPGSPHEGRRAPHAQPTSALRAHTPCWLAMAWSFLNCSSTFSTIFIRAASRRYSSTVCLLELMSLRCSSVKQVEGFHTCARAAGEKNQRMVRRLIPS